MWGGVAGSKRLVSAPADELRDDHWVAERDLDDVRPPSQSAEGLPAITYRSGGLDEAEIRKVVCDILEGGEEAFWQEGPPTTAKAFAGLNRAAFSISSLGTSADSSKFANPGLATPTHWQMHRWSAFTISYLVLALVLRRRYLLSGQTFVFLHRKHDHHRAAVLFHNYGLGACGVDHATEVVLRLAG